MLIVGSGYAVSQRLGGWSMVEVIIGSNNRKFLRSITKTVYFDYITRGSQNTTLKSCCHIVTFRFVNLSPYPDKSEFKSKRFGK